MTARQIVEHIRPLCELSFARSGGPGGQNVNKVSSKVIVRLPLNRMTFLDAEDRARAAARLARRINAEGQIVLAVQDTRDQAKNREIAFDRLAELIAKALVRPKARRKTKPSRAAREARIGSKKRRSADKKLRGRMSGEE